MTLIETIDAARMLLNEPLASSRTFPDNTSGFWQDSHLITYYNLVQQDISTEIMQTFEDYFLTSSFLAVSAGTAEYTLPSRFVKMRRVEDARPSEPTEILPVTLNHKSVKGFVSNVSSSIWLGGYYLHGNRIVFEDTPSFTNASAIRMHFIRALADVSAGSDSSDIPVEHHRIHVWGIVKYGLFAQQSDTTKADLEYDKLLTKLKLQCEDRQIQRPRAVKTMLARY